MKILFTGDTQASWHNLDKCDSVLEDIERICRKHNIAHVVHTGDVKDQFNPIDLRVVNWAVGAIKRLAAAGIQLYIDLGNHDRAGMSDTTDDWFPILQAAGAICASTVRTIQLPHKHQLVMVPYSRDNDWLKAAFRKVAKRADPEHSILVFHCELQGCQHNRLVKSRGEGLVSVGDLCPDKYLFCLGGHIHLHQDLGQNVYYVGSPFAYDWGEANQRKGYVIADTHSRKIKFIPSTLPGLYDPLWPGFEDAKPKSWQGATVRVHVPCDSSVVNIIQFLDQAKVRALKDYPDAEVVIEPEFLDETVADFKLQGDDDVSMIRTYVDAHCVASLTNAKRTIVSYLAHKLERVSFLRRPGGRTTFISARARNFLSFKKLRIHYNRPGITVIQGENKDWPGRSNGSGKTSFLQVPIVALTGETLKGQKHDAWANRRTTGPAIVDFRFRSHDGRKCRIIRGRRPGKVQLFVNGKDKSSGIGATQTQKAIEIMSGHTWDMLVSSIYVSQAEVTKILTGTDGDRKAIFSQFLNLERFKMARDFISRDVKRTTELIGEVEESCANYDKQVQQVQKFMLEIEAGNQSLSSAMSEFKARKRDALRASKVLKRASNKVKVIKKTCTVRFEKLDERYAELQRHISKIGGQSDAAATQLAKMEKVKGVCPVCMQAVSPKWIAKQTKHLDFIRGSGCATVTGLEKERAEIRASLDRLQKRVNTAEHTAYQAASDLELAVEKLAVAKQALKAAKKRSRMMQRYKRERQQLRRRVSLTTQAAVQLQKDLAFFRFCYDTFSKDGLPAFLAYQLCPRLNKAAEHYSKMFSEGQIHVKFEQDAEDINVRILNAHGGEAVDDQSQGELRIASSIASFALREVTSSCNLLVLDEPGEGLDARNAKEFAAALREAAKRFGTVFVTTHNANIIAELSSERTVTVVKHNGISRIKTV